VLTDEEDDVVGEMINKESSSYVEYVGIKEREKVLE